MFISLLYEALTFADLYNNCSFYNIYRGANETVIHISYFTIPPWMFGTIFHWYPVADPDCARGGGVSHILAEKRGVSFTLFKKMHENAIFSPIRGEGGGVHRVRPMLDPPLGTCGMH